MEGYIIAVLFGIACCSLLFSIKYENAFKNQMIVLSAIEAYINETENYCKGIDLLDNMESSLQTALRMGDWGYKNILPKEDFELIKPYIKEK